MNRTMVGRMLELVGITVVLSGIVWWGHAREAFAAMDAVAPGEVTVNGARTWGETALWVDARGREAWEASRIGDAVWLNEGAFDEGIEDFLLRWTPGVPVVVYCDSEACDASAAVAERLRSELGIENVWVLKGGWDAWMQ